MRQAKRDRQELYYALFGDAVPILDENGDDTLETASGYMKPVKFYASISPDRGEASIEPFGMALDYSKTIVTTEELPIVEGTRIWYETAPPDGISDGSTADYTVVAVAKSIHISKYAIRKIVK